MRIVLSGPITLSTEEWLISLSCQRGMFSNAAKALERTIRAIHTFVLTLRDFFYEASRKIPFAHLKKILLLREPLFFEGGEFLLQFYRLFLQQLLMW